MSKKIPNDKESSEILKAREEDLDTEKKRPTN